MSQIDQVTKKIEERNAQIKQRTREKDEIEVQYHVKVRKVDDLETYIKKMEKKFKGEDKELRDKMKANQGEVDVLKEMIRSTKLQLKSKDTDIQRLNIKIKRLEKTNEIRENMLSQVAQNLKNGKDIDMNALQPGSVTGGAKHSSLSNVNSQSNLNIRAPEKEKQSAMRRQKADNQNGGGFQLPPIDRKVG